MNAKISDFIKILFCDRPLISKSFFIQIDESSMMTHAYPEWKVQVG